jgi:hypothetical protein
MKAFRAAVTAIMNGGTPSLALIRRSSRFREEAAVDRLSGAG